MDNQPLIFVCSPFGGMFHNMIKTAELCKRVMNMGAIPYAPHMIFPWLLDEQNGREKGIQMGAKMLLKCDALFYDSLNEITKGMEQEIMFARANDIPVLATFESIDRFKRGF